MPASTILLLESEPSSDDIIDQILTGAGYQVTRTSDPDGAIAQAADHQLLVIDVASGVRSTIEICAQVRSTPNLSQVPVLCVSPSDDVEEPEWPHADGVAGTQGSIGLLRDLRDLRMLATSVQTSWTGWGEIRRGMAARTLAGRG